MFTAPNSIQTLDPLFIYQIEPETSTSEKSAFILSLEIIRNPCISATNQNKKKTMFLA